MIRRLLSFLGVLAVAAALIAVPTLALAQAATASPTIDWKDAGAKAILGLSTVVTYLAIEGFKRLWAKVPAASVFIVAPVLGIGIDWAVNYFAGHPPGDVFLAAIFGLLSVVLNNVKTTIAAKGVTGTFTIK